ncbi:MAG: multidrug effflux MFS transporter [Betaproteobacteria bacterium]|nr:multidrug effflux MFS transporter [Betaproteobacteria bacterium]
MLAGLAMIGPFSIDTYLPSFPAIGRELAVTPLELQQTLSVYLITFAVMTLFHGTLSDSFGRRPVILASLVVYTLASVGCAAAQNFAQLLLFRGVQGLCGGVGWVVGRAIIRDSFPGHKAQRLMSLVTMIFGLAPVVAPMIGGWLQGRFGWQSVFVFLALYGGLLLAVCHLRLPETHPPAARQPFALAPLARNYLTLASSVRLALLCLAVALNFSGFFLYIASAPAFIYGLLALGEDDFPVLFVPGIAGVMIGAYLSGRMAGRLSPQRTVAIGYAIMFCAATGNLGYNALFPPALPWSVLPVMAYSAGMSLAMPNLSLLALDLFPQLRGMVSSLQAFAHSSCTALTAGLISPLLSGTGLGLALGSTALVALGSVSWMTYRRIESRSALHA